MEIVPLPSHIDATALPEAMIDRLIAHRAEWKRWADEACRLTSGSDGLEKWGSIALVMAGDVESALSTAILALDPEFRDWDVVGGLKKHWPARGAVSGGRLYMVAPDREGGEDSRGIDVMHLSVVETRSIVDLEGGKVAS